jgi:hypothetical protein
MDIDDISESHQPRLDLQHLPVPKHQTVRNDASCSTPAEVGGSGQKNVETFPLAVRWDK